MTQNRRIVMNIVVVCGRSLLKFFRAWLVVNVFLALPLVWAITWFVPERLEVNVKASQGITLKVGKVLSDGSIDYSRVVSVKGGGATQTLKAYFSDPLDVSTLALLFGNGKETSYEIDSVAVLRHCFFRSTLSSEAFARAFERKGGVFVPRRGVTHEWQWGVGSDKRLLMVVGFAELLLLLLCTVSLFFRTKWSGAKDVRDAMSVSAVTAFLACVAIPVQSFLANRSLFQYSGAAFWGEAIILFIIVWLFLSVALFFAGRSFGRLPHLVLLSLVFYEYLETGILAMGLPQLNGEVGFFANATRQHTDTYILVGIVLAFLVLYHWLRDVVPWVAGALSILILASLFDIRVERPADDSGLIDAKFLSKLDVAKNAIFSAKRNVMMFILDSMTVEAAADVMASDPVLRGKFTGFTEYRNNVGMGPYTESGLPGIMTGSYGEGLDVATFACSIFATNSFIAPYIGAEIDVSFIPALYDYGYSSRGTVSTKDKPKKRETPFAQRTDDLLSMSLSEIVRFRMTPFALKSWYLTMIFMGLDNHAKVDVETVLYPILGEAPVDKMVKLTLHVYHTHGSHPPIAVDADGNQLIRGRHDDYQGLLGQTHFVLRRLADLLDSLRARSIYDNSTIVVCADHGQLICKHSASGEHPISPRAFPVLWVKPENDHSDFSSCDESTSHANLAGLMRSLRTTSLSREQITQTLKSDKRRYREAGGEWIVGGAGDVKYTKR